MLKMLKENGPPPDGRFADLKFLEPVRDYKARHASTMLTFDAVVDAIGQIEAKRGEARRADGLPALARWTVGFGARSRTSQAKWKAAMRPKPTRRYCDVALEQLGHHGNLLAMTPSFLSNSPIVVPSRGSAEW